MRATSFLSTIAFTFTSLSVAVPSISGFTLQWSDDFNGNAGTLPSSNNWIIDTGTSYNSACPSQWGTGEIETYTKSTSNVALDGNGHLAITPLKSSSGAWTSARIETVRTDFAAPANGRMIMQASISLPNLPASQSQGLWPAFWALGSGYRGQCQGWPAVGEFDIMESVNGLNQAYGTLHCGVYPGGVCNEGTGLGSTIACPGSACQGNFHTYTIELDRRANPQTLTWSIDGVAYQTIKNTTLGASTWQSAVLDSKFLLLNLAVGGGWPGNPNSATVSGTPMKVDWVAVYYG